METPAPGDQLDGDTLNDGVTTTPGWVTVIGTETVGLPEVVDTVTVAERADVPVFSLADNDNVPLPEPDVGDTCNHD